MKIANLVITSKDELDKSTQAQVAQATKKVQLETKEWQDKFNHLQKYLTDELNKFHKQQNDKETSVAAINKNLSWFGMPYTQFLSGLIQRKQGEVTDLDTLKFWADELPNSPQTIEFIVSSVFSRGGQLHLREGAAEKKELKALIESKFREMNQNKTTVTELLKTAIRHAHQVGDAFIEMVPNKRRDKYVEFETVKPWQVKVIEDPKMKEQGITRVIGYAKVKHRDKTNIEDKNIPKENIVPVDRMIHIKYADEGDAYGHAPLEKNQEMTRLIINIMNMNQKKFTNEIRHSLVVKLGKKATQIDADAFLAQYKANYLGKNNFGKPLVVFGDIEVEKWELEDKDFDYMNFMQKIGKNHAPSLYNVSPSEISNDDAKYSNASQGHISTVLNKIYDWQTRVEDIINNEIIRGLEGLIGDTNVLKPSTYYYKLDRENVLSSYDLLQAVSIAVMSGYITPNQARQIIDSRNLGTIDEDWANQYYVKLGNNMAVISQEFFPGTDDAEKSVIGQGGDQLLALSKMLKNGKIGK